MLSLLSTDELRELFLSLPVAACLLDRNAQYLAATEKYASILDTSLVALRNKSMADFCPPELVANVLRDFRAFDSGKPVQDHEITFRNNAYLVSVGPIYRGGNDRPIAISVALTEISRLKRLEASLARANENLFEAYKHIKIFAETDSLTGLLNRHGLELILSKEIRRSRRERQSISLLMVDVDWFKPYNDNYGHIAGDTSLRAVSSAIQSAIRRPGDWAARYGGEEFIVILPNTDIAGARYVGSNIIRAVDDLAIVHDGSPLGRVTVSLGVAGVEAGLDGMPTEAICEMLLDQADKALYGAKAAGRNSVRVHGDR